MSNSTKKTLITTAVAALGIAAFACFSFVYLFQTNVVTAALWGLVAGLFISFLGAWAANSKALKDWEDSEKRWSHETRMKLREQH